MFLCSLLCQSKQRHVVEVSDLSSKSDLSQVFLHAISKITILQTLSILLKLVLEHLIQLELSFLTCTQLANNDCVFYDIGCSSLVFNLLLVLWVWLQVIFRFCHFFNCIKM